MANPVLDSASTDLVPIHFWTDCRGLDLVSPNAWLSRDHLRSGTGLRINEQGHLVSSEVTTADAGLASSQLGITPFVLRLSNKDFEVYMGTTVGFQWKMYDTLWAALTGPALVGLGVNDRFSFVRWNSNILAVSPVTGIHELDTGAKTYAAVAGSPNAFHLATLANRVIATRITGNLGRIQWCVKNDSTDWAGLGSGNEDLLAAAGSRADRPWSTWPIGETTAIVVCEEGLFLMSATDNFDAPFRFSRIVGEGTPYPHSVAAIPGGIIYAGWNDFWKVTESTVERLGYPSTATAIFGQDQGADDHPSITTHGGVYVPAIDEYWFTDQATTFRYSLTRKTWIDGLKFQGSMAYAEGFRSGTKVWAVYHAQGGNAVGVSDGRISIGGGVGGGFELISGDLEVSLPEYRLDVAYVSIEYLTRDTTKRTIRVHVSKDDGNWVELGSFETKAYVASSVNVAPNQRTHIGTVQKGFTASKVAFKITSNIAPERFKLLRMTVYCNKSGWVPTTR